MSFISDVVSSRLANVFDAGTENHIRTPKLADRHGGQTKSSHCQAEPVPRDRSTVRPIAWSGASSHGRDYTEEQRLLGGAKVSTGAVPIARPGLPNNDVDSMWLPRTLDTQPRRVRRSKPWQKYPGEVNGQLDTRASRGDNVPTASGLTRRSSPDFPDRGSAKRRKTAQMSPEINETRAAPMAVDLTGEEDHSRDLVSDPEIQVTSSEWAQRYPPHVTSRHSHKSQSRKFSQPSIAEDFGKLPEYESVLQRANVRQRTRNGERRRFVGVEIPSRKLRRVIDVAPDEPERRTGRTYESDRHTLKIFEDEDQESSRSTRHLRRNERHNPRHAESGSDVEPESEDVAPLDRIAHSRHERPINHDRLSLLNNAYTQSFNRRAAGVEAKSRTERQELLTSQHFESSSDDELANDDSHFAIRDARGVRSSIGATQSPGDIQRSMFTRTKPALSLTRNTLAGGGQSGWKVSSLYSDLIPDGVKDAVLQPTSKFYYIVRHGHRVNAIDMPRMKEIIYGGKKIILQGLDDKWAALDFDAVPERLGCSNHLKRSLRQITVKDTTNRDIMDRRFTRLLEEKAAAIAKTAPAHSLDQPDEQLTLLRAKKNRGMSTPLSRFEGLAAPPSTRTATQRLISQTKTPDKSERIEHQIPVSPFKEPRQLDSSSKDVFAFDDDSSVLATVDNRLVRRSGRATRTTSRYFQKHGNEDEGQVIVPIEERYSRKHGLGPRWDFSITYPLVGKDRATVEYDDLERLDDGEFLNDNLIEFYLRWARQQQIDKENYNEGDMHFFNTFFYEKLASGGRNINHTAVQTWTRKIDIFDYDYIVVPVNESAHWYVCIICNLPHIKRKFEVTDLTTVGDAARPDEPHTPSKLGEGKAHDDDVLDEGSANNESPFRRDQDETNDWPNPSENPQRQNSSPFVRDSGPSQDSVNLVKSEGLFKNAKTTSPLKKNKRRKSGPPPRRYDSNTPIIITLDSLSLTHAKTTSNLKDYIVAEGAAKHSFDIQKDQIKAINATRGIPQQTNFCDCGLFLLGYMHKFLLDPRDFITKILSNELDEERDWPDMDPSRLRANMRDMLQAIYKKQVSEREKTKKKKTKKPTVGASGPVSENRQATPSSSRANEELPIGQRHFAESHTLTEPPDKVTLVGAAASRGDNTSDLRMNGDDELLLDVETDPGPVHLLPSQVIRGMSRSYKGTWGDAEDGLVPKHERQSESPRRREVEDDHVKALEELSFPALPGIASRYSPRSRRRAR